MELRYSMKSKHVEFIGNSEYSLRVYKDCGLYYIQVYNSMYQRIVHDSVGSFDELKDVFKVLKVRYL